MSIIATSRRVGAFALAAAFVVGACSSSATGHLQPVLRLPAVPQRRPAARARAQAAPRPRIAVLRVTAP